MDEVESAEQYAKESMDHIRRNDLRRSKTQPRESRRIIGTISLPNRLSWSGGSTSSIFTEIDTDLMPLHLEDQLELLDWLREKYPNVRWKYLKKVQSEVWEPVQHPV